MFTEISDRCFVSLWDKLLLLSGTIGGGAFPIVGEELTVCSLEGKGRSPGANIRFNVDFPLRAVLEMSSERSMSDSSRKASSSSSPVAVLTLAPRLREGPALCWTSCASRSVHAAEVAAVREPAARWRLRNALVEYSFEVELTVFPRTGRVAESEGLRNLMNESTEIDFLRLAGAVNVNGAAGKGSSGLFVVGVAVECKAMEESAVMKVS